MLTSAQAQAYAIPVTVSPVAGIGVPELQGAQPPSDCGFFVRDVQPCLFNGGLGGTAARLAGPLEPVRQSRSVPPPYDWRRLEVGYSLASKSDIMNTTDLVPVFTGEFNGQPVQLVNARNLHQFLESNRQFADWIKERIEEYGFVENHDFILISQKRETKGRGGDRRSKDYHVTLDTAKELAMVERNDKGRQARRYFIECERKAHEAAAHQPHDIKALPADIPSLPSSLPLNFEARLQTYLADKTITTQAAILRDVLADALDSDGLRIQVGKALIRQGWRKQRSSAPGRPWVYVRSENTPAALPPVTSERQILLPLNDLSPELLQAISRKAQALAIEGFDRIRQRLEQRLRDQIRYRKPEELLQWLDQIGGPDAELVVLSAHELWGVTSSVAVANIGIEAALAAVHELEAKTGRLWHGRSKEN
jgi:phage anti-repressor protein